MELISVKVSRCLSIIFLAIALGLLCVLVPCWYSVVKRVERHVDESSQSFVSQVQSEVDKTTKFLNLISSSSTIYTARVIASLNQSKLSFSDVENKVAPFLFQALSITPHLTQISYFGSEGLFFSYYIDRNQTFALYSNSSVKPSNNNSRASPYNPPSPYWYTQMADRVTGKLYGEVDRSSPSIAVTNASWFQEALNRDGLCSFIGTKLSNVDELLFINTATVNGKLGFVSLGFSFKEITEYYYNDIDLQGGSLCLVINGGADFKIAKNLGLLVKVIKKTIDIADDHQHNFSCYPIAHMSSSVGDSSLDIADKESNSISYGSQIDILGVRSDYAFVVPKSGLMEFVNQRSKLALIVLVSFIGIMVVFIIIFLSIIFGATMRVVYLHAKNFKQMEATEQAERKSMNKTNAFNTASHDIRASLAGMTGLIQICYDEVAPGSDLETNLRQLDDCAKDLLEMLNSILDTSKIEAGKMLLEDEEFDVAQLLEDVVDLFHPMGVKKGVDVILDPCNGSISKFSLVKCDRGKLRQVLCNLLSNAVKFTSEGQVVVRAWIRERRMENSIIASKPTTSGLLQSLACIFDKSKGQHKDLEAMDNMVNNDPNSMELVCEVDDTGKGIPIEKRQEIFENYVQVKDTALGQGGTGLGLGIVQSLVRLMHGEIGIIEKDIGEKGSCFRFNISLTICENVAESTKEYEDENTDMMISSTSQSSVLTPSPSKVEAGSYVVLLIQNNERRRMSQKFMESLGIRVLAAKWPNQLHRSLKKIQRKWCSSSNKFDFGIETEYSSKSSASHNSCNFDVPFSSTAMDGADYVRSLFRSKTNHLRGMTSSLGFVLMVIDANSGTFQELSEAVNEFRNSLQNAWCRVVWLANPVMPHGVSFSSREKGLMLDPDDIIKCKPFHGSRLYEVIRLLPEFGGPLPKRRVGPSASLRVSINVSEACNALPRDHDDQITKPNQCEIQEHSVTSISEIKPLSGKKVLVVDDTRLLRQLAKHCVEKLGGTVEQCENGEEALKLVSNGLSNQRKQHGSNHMRLPYDYILMDCEMPKKNGYEATKVIREEEKFYGVYTPIIALTAHTQGSEEANKTFKAGMDACLCKPLKEKDLLEAIKQIRAKNSNI